MCSTTARSAILSVPILLPQQATIGLFVLFGVGIFIDLIYLTLDNGETIANYDEPQLFLSLGMACVLLVPYAHAGHAHFSCAECTQG